MSCARASALAACSVAAWAAMVCARATQLRRVSAVRSGRGSGGGFVLDLGDVGLVKTGEGRGLLLLVGARKEKRGFQMRAEEAWLLGVGGFGRGRVGGVVCW